MEKSHDFEERLNQLKRALDEVKNYPESVQQEALRFLLSSASKQEPQSSPGSSQKKRGGNRSGIASKMTFLLEEGFFSEPRSINDIIQKLSELGFSISPPYLSPQLIYLTRKGMLSRHKNQEGRYVYYRIKS